MISNGNLDCDINFDETDEDTQLIGENFIKINDSLQA
jgi:hypothetical protein